MYRLDKDIKLTPAFILDVVNKHNSNEGARIRKLNNYYKAKQDILKRTMEDPTKPNNKLVNPFANYITDVMVGYFMGAPVSYSSLDEDALNELKMILNYNDEQDENTELAKGASIAGKTYELVYIDEDAQIRFRALGANEVVIIYDDTLDSDILYGIRYYPFNNPITGEKGYKIDVYSKTDIKHYRCGELFDTLVSLGEETHPFKLVPIVEYKNNEEELGDFEPVISLIDAYDKMESNTLDDFDYFCDAYLALVNMMGTEPEDVLGMKKDRVMLLPQDSDAKFITKQVDVNYIESQKERLVEDIHKFSKCPNLSDAQFASNASGVAMSYKIMGTESLTGIKERKFKKGLQRRIELIFNILDLYGNKYDWRGIDITFSRNLPVDDSATADLVNKLRGIVSDETLLSQLSFIDNASDELERREQESSNKFELGGYFNEAQDLLGTKNEGLGEVRE